MAGFDELLRNALGSQATDASSQSRGLVEGRCRCSSRAEVSTD